ncbi:MAG: glycosyltransferase [Candidatus Rokubacteria bacterium]|nr:glycosyltransferase [Candidatus Rokubacteria bacterium]
MIVAAYNEGGCIAGKIRSTFQQRYPWDCLELIVVSDGSTDGTDDVVKRYPDPRVKLIRQEPRSGKSVALNRGVAAARGDVLVFTDANAVFAPGAIARLAAPFDDRRVGLVSGQGLYASGAADARAVSNGYVRFEAFLKRGEAALGFVAGADGAIYALRRELYRELHGAQVNDLLHPVQAALAGTLCRFDPKAFTLEPPSRGGSQEFSRHVRIIAQGVHIVREWLPRLVAARRWRAVWMLVSHRMLRWVTAPSLGVMLLANARLAGGDTFYAITLAGQGLFYATALTGYLAERLGVHLGPLAIPYYFCTVAAAGIVGLARFARRGAESVWAPRGHAAVSKRA